MARHELLIEAGVGCTRVALVRGGRLEAYHAETVIGGDAGQPGAIFLGRVTKVVPAMEAAFVDLGLARDGFLPLRDAAEAVTEGMALIVRVARTAFAAKGPRLTARVKPAPDLVVEGKVPQLLRPGPGMVAQVLKDLPRDVPVFIDDARMMAALVAAFPHLDITLVREDLFARHDLEEQVAALAGPRVGLPSGGWITLQATEGMTAIDVNSGGFAAAGGRAETARSVNLEAAHEAARQIRLRGIGGLIVIDFIESADGALVAALEQGLGDDSRVSLLRDFGVVAIARRHGSAPVMEQQVCRCCGGRGRVATAEAKAQEILTRVERAARAAPGREIMVRAGADVLDWLNLHQGAVRAGLDRRGVGRVRFEARAGDVQTGEGFDVTTG